MKIFTKISCLLLVLILSVALAVGSSACDLSKFNFGKKSGSSGVVTDKDKDGTDNKDEDNGEEDKDDDGDKTGDKDDKDKETQDDKGEEENASVFPDFVTFYKYIDAFDGAQSTLTLNITGREMFAAYIEYVLFYGISAKVNLVLSYTSAPFEEEYNAAHALYDQGTHLVIPCSYGWEIKGGVKSFFVTGSSADALATKTLDVERAYVAEQTDYALKMTAPNTRAEDYDDFKLNSAEKAIGNITNTEQLRWAVQNGYKPVCQADSPAERALNNAKAVLREIILDDMDDITKIRAIYEWLALNVSYDNYAASKEVDELIATNVIKTSEYDSWYVEGVFNNRKAVCEGYAKAFVLMAGLEGIPAVVVTGNGHAWNRVLIDGAWYVLDATHADLHVSDQEVFTYSQFMITDEEKAYRGFATTDYADFTATTAFNVYETIKFDYLGSQHDLVIESEIELSELLTKAKLNKAIDKDSTVTAFISAENAENVSYWLGNYAINALSNKSTSSLDINKNAYYIFYLR